MIGKPSEPKELHELLEERCDYYNRQSFIESDPISVPHQFSSPDDIEIAAFLTATISWGQRPVLIRNANRLMQLMDHSPAHFIRNFTDADLRPFSKFVHRTFNGQDCLFFLKALQRLCNEYKSLENAFLPEQGVGEADGPVKDNILLFRERFLGREFPTSVSRHISDPSRNSAAKRLNMFLRWMVRNDTRKVDFGIWQQFNKAKLMMPLDVHSGRVARKLGLLQRIQDDWKAVEELTLNLRQFDPNDPVKYDYALFGMGVLGEF